MKINLTLLLRFFLLYLFLNIFSSYIFILGDVGNIIFLIVLLIFYIVGNYINSLRLNFLLFNNNDIINEYFIKLNFISFILKIYKYNVYLYINNLLYILNNIIYIYIKMTSLYIISNKDMVNILFNNLIYYLFYNIRYYKKLSQLIIINIINKKLRLITSKL